jgi:hypothetical protein
MALPATRQPGGPGKDAKNWMTVSFPNSYAPLTAIGKVRKKPANVLSTSAATATGCVIPSFVHRASALPPVSSKPDVNSRSLPASSEQVCTGPSAAPMQSSPSAALDSADAFRTSGKTETIRSPHDRLTFQSCAPMQPCIRGEPQHGARVIGGRLCHHVAKRILRHRAGYRLRPGRALIHYRRLPAQERIERRIPPPRIVSRDSTAPPALAACLYCVMRPTFHPFAATPSGKMKLHVFAPTPLASVSVVLA